MQFSVIWNPQLLDSYPIISWEDHLRLFSQPRVSLPHKNPTRSFWTHGSSSANPLAREGSQGPLTTDADIVIIGSGITGVSAAYHLSELVAATNLSLNILILEARDFCSGATGRNGGHLTPSVFKGFGSIADRYAVDEAIKWFALENHTTTSIISLFNSSLEAAEVDLVHGLHLDLFYSDKEENEFKTDWELAKKAGVELSEVRFFSAKETRQLYGPAFPSVRYPGHNLWPLKAVTRIFQLAQRKLSSLNRGLRLSLHTHTPVTSITPIENEVSPPSLALPRRWRLETARGAVRAHVIIHATNGYAAHLLPFMAVAPEQDGIVPTRGQVIATRSSVGPDTLLTPSYAANDGYEYWFPRPVNKTAERTSDRMPLVILGGGREVAGPAYELGITDDSVLNPTVSKKLREFLPETYPKGWFQKGRQPEMEWTGIMGYTKSKHPFVGAVVDYVNGIFLEGQYIAAGYNGHGMPRAFGCAEALVQMIASDLKNEAWNIPDWFPDHFLTTSRLSSFDGY